MEALLPASLQQGDTEDGEPVMSDVISIFLTISDACAKTRHHCCSAPTRDLPARRPTVRPICNNERQARHLGGDQLRQDQAEEDRDTGEESPAFKRNHRTGEGGEIVKPLPPVMHCTPPSSRIALFSVTSFSCITL